MEASNKFPSRLKTADAPGQKVPGRRKKTGVPIVRVGIIAGAGCVGLFNRRSEATMPGTTGGGNNGDATPRAIIVAGANSLVRFEGGRYALAKPET